MRIRSAGPGDTAAIAQIHVETWRDTYAGILPDRVLLHLSEGREKGGWTGAILRGESVFVAESDSGEIMGFGSCGPNRLPSIPCKGEIYTLYVAPNHQAQGIGQALTRHMLTTLRDDGMASVVVWVLRENPSRFFYEAMGGRRLAEREEKLWGVDVAQVGYQWSQAAGPGSEAGG